MTEPTAAPGAAPAGAAPIVRLAGVDKVFAGRDGARTMALQGIDLDIAPGEFVSLIGPSGCGKSTLLRIIGDLVQPSAGDVVVNGKPAGRARLDRDYGMVFQAPVLFDWRSVEDNVKLPLEILGRDKAWRAQRAKEMLELVDLGEFTRHMPYQLSGGMQQRVAIARALSFEPRILLMDEPFGALDEMTRERLNDEVLRIWEQTGTTIVFVTHSIPEAVFLSSRVVVMSPRPGQITKIVDIDLPRPRTDAVRESEAYFARITDVREALRAGGGHGADDGDRGTAAGASAADGSAAGGTASARRTAAEGAVG
jgi:NitT/TauT family transport system ATP-binding protein